MQGVEGKPFDHGLPNGHGSIINKNLTTICESWRHLRLKIPIFSIGP